MTRRAAATLALLLAAPAAAHAETTTITMPGRFFDPPRSTMVARDIVEFRNSDLVTHDVVIAPFSSGPMARFTAWTQQIDQPGSYPFVCTLHAFMRGNLDVVAASLAAAPDGVLAGERLTLSGRTRAGTVHVGVEQSVSGGAWSTVGTGATPAPDGTFTTTVPAVEAASYRVTTPDGPSPVVTPRITARVDIHVHVERRGRLAIVHVDTMPSVTGFTATLELYSRWHFRWRARRRATLDRHGHAAFRLPARPRRLARVVVRRTHRGPAVVRSGVVTLPAGRPARDPDTLLPGGTGPDGSAGHGGHAPEPSHTQA